MQPAESDKSLYQHVIYFDNLNHTKKIKKCGTYMIYTIHTKTFTVAKFIHNQVRLIVRVIFCIDTIRQSKKELK